MKPSARSHPQQRAGGVDRSFGQQLARQVEVRFGLHVTQGHCGKRREDGQAGGPRSQLRHLPEVLLVEVERAAGGPRLHGGAVRPVERHRGEAKGVDQRDGVTEDLRLGGRAESHQHPVVQHLEEKDGARRDGSDLDSVQADDVSDLKDVGMVLQLLTEDSAADLLVRLIGDLQTGAVVCGERTSSGRVY